MSTEQNKQFKSSNYELFILALSILSLFNWVMYLLQIDEDLLFVYGTLRPAIGHPMYKVLSRHADLIGTGAVRREQVKEELFH